MVVWLGGAKPLEADRGSGETPQAASGRAVELRQPQRDERDGGGIQHQGTASEIQCPGITELRELLQENPVLLRQTELDAVRVTHGIA